jgi:hypothetical protein
VPDERLRYAQVKKRRVRRRIVDVVRRVVYGTPDGVQGVLGKVGQKINTAFIERVNRTLRARAPGLGRRKKGWRIRWQTEAFTEVEIPNPMQALSTSPVVVKRVRELAATHTDREMAAVLNEERLTSQQGKAFTEQIVKSLRRRYKIPGVCPEGPWLCPDGRRGDGRYSIRGAAEALNVSESTIRNWCLAGRLDSIQAVPGGHRWIKLTAEDIAALRKPVPRCRHSQR